MQATLAFQALGGGCMIGEVVGRYRILEELGSGAMGVVYRAQDTFLGRYAALKLIAEKYLEDAEALGRFERELEATSTLRHPNICTVFETGRWHSRPYMAMELLEGAPLSDRIQKGPLSLDELLCIAIPVAGGLEAAHKLGIVHRDIKPANLFLTARGEVKILDFGLAKIRRRQIGPIRDDAATLATFVTSPGTLLGTYAYMAPEQVRREAVDGRADLYSLGVVLYEMATGKLLLQGAGMTPVPAELREVIARLTAHNRDARYQNAGELRTALENLPR